MKANKKNPLLVAILSLVGFTVSLTSASAANRYWDGGTIDIVANGNTASGGTAGTWDTTILNWDAGASPHVAWVNANNDTAIFGGTAAAVTLGVPITAGGLSFSHTTGTYTLQTGVLTLAADSIIKATAGGGTASLATMTAADNIFRFQSTVTTNNIANATNFTVSSAIGGASTAVQILGNGASTAAPVVLSGTLTYGGGTTVADKAALGFSTATVTGLAAGSVAVGTNSTILRTGGNLNQAFLGILGSTTNPFTIVANNAGTSAALNLTNFPSASLATWDNAGTVTFAFTGAITPGSNGFLFGSTRVGNIINIGGTNATGAVTNNILTGTTGLTLLTGSLGNMNLWGSNTYSGTTINNATGKTITLNSALAMQNSAIDTSGAGTYVLGTGSSGTGGNGGAAITTPTIGGLIGSKNLLTNLFAATGYNLMTSLTLNPGTGVTNTYSGVIANSTAGLALTKSGAGTQILSGLNTFAGNLTVSNGTLVGAVAGTGGNSAFGSVVSTRTINVNAGGTLRFDVGNVFNNNFSSASVPALNIAGGTVTNGGTATNSALGNVTLAGGTLTATVGSASGYGSWNLNGTVTSTGTSLISSSAGVPITLSAAAGTTTTFDVQSGTLTASAELGQVTGSGDERISGLTKIGAGTLVLAGINSYTGNTTINAGALSIATKDALPGYNTTGRFSVASGTTLVVQNGVSNAEITTLLATGNFLTGANLGFDTTAGNRDVSLNLADTASGPLGVVKLGANTLTLSGTNTYTGGTNVMAGALNLPSTSLLPGWNVDGGFSIASGASLIIPNGVSESEVTTMLGTTNIAAGASLLFDTSAGNRTNTAAVTNSPQGLLNIGKIGANTLTLAGANTYSGTSTVTEGRLVLSGSTTTTGNLVIGNTTANAVLTIPTSGAMTAGTVSVGTTAASIGALNISGGSLSCVTPETTDTIAFGTGEGAYGAFTLSSGTFTQQRFMFGGTGASVTGGTGVGLIAGGTVNSTGWLILARAGGSTGTLTITGGTLNHAGATNDFAVGLGTGTASATTGRAELNVAGGLIDNTGRRVTFSAGTGGTFHWAGTGIVNLNAGTLLTNAFNYDSGSPNASSYVNFSGGTLKAAASSATFLPAFTPSGTGTNRVLVHGAFGAFSGGATIDTNGFTSTISANLLAPSGNGVTSLSIDSAGSGYIGAPAVRILDNGQPSTATAYAVVDTDSSSPTFGQLTSVVITNPGEIAGTATVSLVGGGGTGAAVSVTATGANTSGGLTKTGAGILTLSGANTYTGVTSVSAGTLNLTGSLTSNVAVANNAALGGEGSTTGSVTFSGANDLGFDPSTGVTYLAANSVNATGAAVTVVPSLPITGTGIVVLDAPGGIAGTAGGVGNNFIYTGRGSLYLNGGNTQLLIDTTPASLAWRGNDLTNPSFWDLNTTTNWDSGTPEKFFTGDALTFDDTAVSYIVDINAANVFPGNITFNNTTPYILQGAFGINGGATLTKNGSGTTVMNGSNGYTGATTVNAGVLNIRNANALGAVTAGTSVASGAAVEIQGGITTAGEPLTLNGSGIASAGALRNLSGDNTWAAAVALASASTIGTDAGTLIIPSLTGAFGLTKVGAGTLNITGATAVTSTTVEAGTLYMGAQTGASTTTTLGAGSAVTLNESTNLVIRRTNTGAVDLFGVIGGAGSLTLLGDNAIVRASGDFTMNNASPNFSGAITITGARAAPTVGTAFGTGPVTVGANGGIFVNATTQTFANNFIIGGLGWDENSGFLGALRLNGTTITGDITLTSNARITSAGTSTLSGIISGTFGMDFFEDTVIGTVSLAGDNTYSGTTIVNSVGSGTTFPSLIVSHNNALGTTAGGTIVNGTGTTGNGSQLTLANGITVTDETLTLDATAAGYRASLITASNGIAVWDGNVVTAGTGGLIGFNANGATSSLTVGSSDADTITGTNTLLMRGAGIGTVNSAINIGTGGLFKTDASVWTITSNNNDFTGTPLIASGPLSVGTIADAGVNSALGAGTTISLGQPSSATAGTLRFTGASGGSSNRSLLINNGANGAGAIENTVAGQTLALSGALTVASPALACSLTLTGAGDGLLSGGIVGTPALALNKTGAGTWTVSGTTNYTGATTVTAGTLTFSAASVIDSATAVGLFTVNGATAVANLAGTYNIGAGNGNAYFEIKGGGTLNFNGTSTLTSTGGGGFRVGEASAGTFNMTGGTLTYTPVAGSNLVVGRTAGGNGTLNVTDGTLTVTGPGGFVIANDATTTGTVTVGGTGTLVINSTTFRIGGNATATAATFNLNTGGTFTLGISPTSTGTSRTFNFDGGTLKASANIAISGLTTANVKDGGAIFDTNGNAITIDQALLNFAGATTDTLTKSGAGTLTLSGVNTYTGATTVNAGSLLVNSPGSLAASSAVAVNGSSTLGGTGTIGGNVTVAAGGNLAPGTSAGTLTIGGALDISALAGGAGTLAYELGTLAGTNDKIVAGTLAIGSGALGLNDFVFTNLGGLQSGTYTLIASGGLTGTLDAGNLTGVIASGRSGTLRINGNDLELVVIAAYEAWANGSFTNPFTDKDPGQNPDGDSLTNLQEFAFGTDPTVLSSGPILYVSGGTVTAHGQPVLLEDGGIYYAVFGRRTDYLAAGLTYTVQFSADLGVWDPSVAAPTPLATDGVIDAVSVPFPGLVPTPGGPQPARFFRVQVSQAP